MSKSVDNILAMIIDKCRICLEHTGSINIFNSPKLIDEIKLSTAIEVKIEDKFPKNICISCKRSIRIAVDLRKKAVNTNSRLIYITESIPETQSEYEDESRAKSSPPRKRKIQHKKVFKIKINAKRKTGNCNSELSNTRKNDVEKEAESKVKSSPPRKRKIQDKKEIEQTQIDNDPKRKRSISAENVSTGSSTSVPNDVEKEIDSNTVISCSTTEGDDVKNESKGPFVCSACNRICPSRFSHFLHMRSHDKSKQFPCPLCQKLFTSRSDLGKHNRVHTGEKPFKCNICDKSFSQNSTLKAHKIIHSRVTER